MNLFIGTCKAWLNRLNNSTLSGLLVEPSSLCLWRAVDGLLRCSFERGLNFGDVELAGHFRLVF